MDMKNSLELIFLRNDFYRKKYHSALGVFSLTLLVIAALIYMLFYLLNHPTHPLYFPADQAGRLIQEVPVDQPNMSTQAVSDWAVEAVEAAYSYDFVNYRAELQSAQKYFTNYGWFTYMKGLTTSNNLVALTQRKMVAIANVVDTPKLIVEGLLGQGYAWKFEMHVLVTYLSPPYDDKSKFQNPLSVDVIVQRQPILSSYQGLGILQMNSALMVSPTGQNLSLPAE